MSLTFQPDLDSVKVNQYAKYLSKWSSSSKRISEYTHTKPIAPPKPLK